MSSEFNDLQGQNNLQAENEFMKMKLMLERGAQIGGFGEKELPPEIENQFLKYIIECEKQFEDRKMIRLYEKIGSPKHFKPVAEIADQDFDKAWEELRSYMNEYSIYLVVCSPNISARELYRFAIEELFNEETEEIDLPGWTTNYIYDEFYPDPVYDNSLMITDELLGKLFRKTELFDGLHYERSGFTFNGRRFSGFEEFRIAIGKFKSLFEEIELNKTDVNFCMVNETDCRVMGNYKAIATYGAGQMNFEGSFDVEMIKDELGYWYMRTIRIDGFDLQ